MVVWTPKKQRMPPLLLERWPHAKDCLVSQAKQFLQPTEARVSCVAAAWDLQLMAGAEKAKVERTSAVALLLHPAQGLPAAATMKEFQKQVGWESYEDVLATSAQRSRRCGPAVHPMLAHCCFRCLHLLAAHLAAWIAA